MIESKISKQADQLPITSSASDKVQSPTLPNTPKSSPKLSEPSPVNTLSTTQEVQRLADSMTLLAKSIDRMTNEMMLQRTRA